jgi:hypothetical protein
VILELLYQLSDKDRTQGLYQRRFVLFQGATAASANVVTAGLQCPVDVVRLIQGVTLSIQGGGAAIPNNAVLDMSYEQAASKACRVCGFQPNPQLLLTELDYFFPTEFLWMPSEWLIAGANFSAAIAGNTVNVDLYGIEFPRGNIQR